MNAAIITKVVVSRTTGQTKLYATCQAKKIRVPWNYEYDHIANHIFAAKQLAEQVGWRGQWSGGGLPDQTGYCFTQIADFYRDPKTNITREHKIGYAFHTEDK